MLSIQTKPPFGPLLKMIFEKSGDRWAHRISWISDDSEFVILQSIEGDDQTEWPPSPPLQAPDQHDLPTGAAVLAVGMAGAGHWSASFSVEQSQFLLADIACFLRSKQPDHAHSLASTYQIATGVEIVRNTPAAIELQHDQGRLLLEAVSGNDHAAAQPSEWGTEIFCTDSNRLSIVAERLNGNPKKSTRWSYRVSCGTET